MRDVEDASQEFQALRKHNAELKVDLDATVKTNTELRRRVGQLEVENRAYRELVVSLGSVETRFSNSRKMPFATPW